MKEKIEEIAKKISKLNSAEISELSEILLTEHNISATIYHFGLATMIDSNQGKTGDLYLTSAGFSKLGCVKYIKEKFGLGLREAKDIIDSVPCLLIELVPSDIGEEIIEELKEFGAKAEIR